MYVSLSAGDKMASGLEVGLNWHHTQSPWKMRRRIVYILYIINPYWKDGLNNTRQTSLKEYSIDLIKISNEVTQEFQPCDHKREYGRPMLLIWRALHDILSDKIKLQNIVWSGEMHTRLFTSYLWEIESWGSFWRRDSILICLELFNSFF